MVPMNLFSQHFISKTVNRAYIFLFSRHGYGVFFVSLLSPCHIQKSTSWSHFPSTLSFESSPVHTCTHSLHKMKYSSVWFCSILWLDDDQIGASSFEPSEKWPSQWINIKYYERRSGLRGEYFAHHTHEWTIDFYRWSGWNRSTQLIRSDNQIEFYFLCVRRPVWKWMKRDRRHIHLIESIRIEFSFVINFPTGNFSLTSFASILLNVRLEKDLYRRWQYCCRATHQKKTWSEHFSLRQLLPLQIAMHLHNFSQCCIVAISILKWR